MRATHYPQARAQQTGSSSRPLEKHSFLSCLRVNLFLFTCDHDKQIILLFLSRRIPICRDFFLGTDIDESLISPHLQKSNRAGVKSYGLAPNDVVIKLFLTLYLLGIFVYICVS